MGLKKPGASPGPTPPAVSPSPSSSQATSAPATTSALPQAGPASAPAPAAQARDLAAMRARLAGGQLGGVNSPEGAEKITEALVAPRTQPTADGGAEPLPSAPDAAPKGESDTSAAAPRKRRTKAEMEAARAAASSPPTTPPPGVAAGASAADPYADVITLHREATEVQVRISAALERIADVLDAWNKDRVPF